MEDQIQHILEKDPLRKFSVDSAMSKIDLEEAEEYQELKEAYIQEVSFLSSFMEKAINSTSLCREMTNTVWINSMISFPFRSSSKLNSKSKNYWMTLRALD
jgi:hypothetical protein